MRIGLLQWLLIGVLTGTGVARDGMGQSVLDRSVTVRFANLPLKDAITKLQAQTNVRFVYSSRIQLNERVSLSAENEKLSSVLNRLLNPLQISYRVINDQIALTRLTGRRSPEVDSSTDQVVPAIEGSASTDANEPAPTERPVRGRVVTADNGEGLPGVNVSIKGTNRGTTTDADGNYQLSVPEGDSVTLVFSFVGYTVQEVVLGNRPEVNVTLQVSANSLNEVVVVGYGEQSRKTLTTSIAKVQGSDLALQPVGTPGEALAALAAGVQVQSGRGGYPGEAPIIRIRGVGSLGASNTPLFVVDGYPLQNPNNFNLINPSDIESIEVLKDAASAAIYGSRAANGVVIVTTKRGKAGKTRFDVSVYHGLQSVSKKLDLMNRDEYIAYAKKGAAAWGRNYPSSFDNPSSLPDTDWQDAIFRTAPISEYQINATGGSENIRYLISGGYFNQEGTLVGTIYKRYTLRFNLDANLSRKLRVGVSLAPSYSLQYRQPAGGQYNGTGDTGLPRGVPSPIHSALLMPPVVPVRYADGRYGQPNADISTSENGFIAQNLYNPLGVLEQLINRWNNFRLLGNGFLEWEPVKNLKLKASLGSTVDFEDQYFYIPPTLASDANPNPQLALLSGRVPAFSQEGNNLGIDWLWENTISYNRSFGQHNLAVVGLYSLQKFRSKFTLAFGRDGTYNTTLLPNPFASPDLVGGLGYDLNAFLSMGGRVNYDYKRKYLLSAAVRWDASSRFGPNQRFATFPSFSGGWRASEEPFWGPLKSLVNEFKIRASYGETGNANIGSFTWLSGIGGSNYSFGGARQFGAAQFGWTNYDLTWEKNRQTDLGLELALLNDKVTFGVDYYNRLTTGMLFNKELPGLVGTAASFRTNIGKLQNRGLELNLGTNATFGALRWSMDINLTGNRTKVLDLGGRESLNPAGAVFGWNNVYRIKVGEPLGQMYGYIVEGVFKSQAELDASPKWVNGNVVGDWKIRDVNGDGKVDENDMTVIGNGFPTFFYGMTHRFNWRGFDLSVIVQGVQGGNIANGNLRHPLNGTGNYNMPAFLIDNNYDPAFADRNPEYYRYFPTTGVTSTNNLTNKALYDASFFRVRNLTLGYMLPTKLLQPVRLQSARVYMTGQNLYTASTYFGLNPETSLNGDTVYQPGLDQGTYPANRIWTVGVNVGF